MMTVGADEIKVLEQSQTMLSGGIVPAQVSGGESTLERVKLSKQLTKNKAYLQPLANANDEVTYPVPAGSGWGRAESVGNLGRHQNLSIPENTSTSENMRQSMDQTGNNKVAKKDD